MQMKTEYNDFYKPFKVAAKPPTKPTPILGDLPHVSNSHYRVFLKIFGQKLTIF